MAGKCFENPIIIKGLSSGNTSKKRKKTTTTLGANKDCNMGRNYKTKFLVTAPDDERAAYLILPHSFNEVYHEDFGEECTLRTPDGKKRKVKVKHDLFHTLMLTKGWSDFTSRYELGYSFTALFLYIGNAKFDVHLFDIMRSEISYTKKVLSRHQMHRTNYNDGHGPDGFRSENPFFKMVLTDSCLKPNGQLWIPATHRRECLDQYEGDIVHLLRVQTTFDVRLVRTNKGIRFGYGWPQFAAECRLWAKSTCIFELVHRPTMTYCVHMY